jgi:hypothetical protein
VGFLDELKQQAVLAANKHGDRIAEGIDKAGEAVNKATDNKYAHQVRKAQVAAKDGVRKAGGPKGPQGPTGPAGPTGPGGPR